MISYQHRKSHCGDKRILRPSYLHNGISFTGKMTSLYWIRAQVCQLSSSAYQAVSNGLYKWGAIFQTVSLQELLSNVKLSVKVDKSMWNLHINYQSNRWHYKATMLYYLGYPDSKVHGAHLGPDGPHVGPMKFAIRVSIINEIIIIDLFYINSNLTVYYNFSLSNHSLIVCLFHFV